MRGVVGILVAALVLVPAGAASAAGGVIELSADGSTWSSSLPPLFAVTPELVPQSSETATFWVRNTATDDGYLQLTVTNLTWSGSEYASALSMAASVPGRPGTALALGSASACMVLLDGVLLAAGQSVMVTTTLALGDLSGAVGQGGSAAMDIGVTLVQSTGSAPSPGCNPATTPATVVTVVPPATAQRSAASAALTAVEHDDMLSLPSFIPGLATLALLPNTLVRFDSSIVGWATAGIPLGAALFFLVGVLRRLVPAHREEHQP